MPFPFSYSREATWRDRREWRWIEYLLLLAGLITVDYYIWIIASAGLSQAYENWSFSQELQGGEVSVGRFIQAQLESLIGLNTPVSAPPVGVRKEPAPKPIEQAPRRLVPPPFLPESSVIGRMEIPRLRLNLMIREGITSRTLRTAVGHLRSTALPGYPGNVALAAHRDTFFRPLRNIQKGDSITIETLSGSYRYAVDSIEIVGPSDVSVLRNSAQPKLTLITCYPFYYVGSAPKRFIVQATQMASSHP